ncbi:MAG: hypothetical protein AAF218_06270 [Pseudomonadota bacterium]
MFTIEHEFDSTVVTLVDEPSGGGPSGGGPLQEDVVINAFAEVITVEQYDERRGAVVRVNLSPLQVRDLAAALDLPEGVYQIRQED